jgi:hypothetical protein
MLNGESSLFYFSWRKGVSLKYKRQNEQEGPENEGHRDMQYKDKNFN